ncbi:trypsin-like peptidase domain-containing protein [Brachybacterium sp. EF45031]|uniref:S1C family serine protease n=1 Tax=Brachybacterium sillae TaxID=2810536 RepID=UPI00217DEDA1|nr:trypsin-like peptidase domain-containing protein [Brachybacterium sillae]MCS6711279.1 trypsin-like peptidase domain-containing protein [Brachybacterium sillae]
MSAPYPAPGPGQEPHDIHLLRPAPEAPAPTRRGPGWCGAGALALAAALLGSGLTLVGDTAVERLLPGTTAEAPTGDRAADRSDERTADTASRPADGTTTDPDWQQVAAEVSASTVAITAELPQGTSQGTGVIRDDQGNIVTNNHVVDGAREVAVSLADGRIYQARIVGQDPSTDIAVLRLEDPPSDLTVATFGDSDAVQVGQPVMAVGTPLGLQNTVTTGIVSALHRPVVTGERDATAYTSAIQTDAAINPGNSGGPLVDATGAVIGINSSIASFADEQQRAGSIGLGFAIPSATALSIADQLIAGGPARHARLGVVAEDAETTVGGAGARGARVRTVEDGQAAAAAGVRQGDVILRVDDVPVDGAAALTGVIRGMTPDSDHRLTLVRDGEVQELPVRLGADG